MNKRLIDRWTEFLTTPATDLTEDDLQQAEADGNSAEWVADPVSAFAPERCEEFRAITKSLGIAYNLGPMCHEAAYKHTPALFQAGCDFGEAVEKMREAGEQADADALRFSMAAARRAWAWVATLSRDAQ